VSHGGLQISDVPEFNRRGGWTSGRWRSCACAQAGDGTRHTSTGSYAGEEIHPVRLSVWPSAPRRGVARSARPRDVSKPQMYGRFMAGHLLRDFELAAILQVHADLSRDAPKAGAGERDPRSVFSPATRGVGRFVDPILSRARPHEPGRPTARPALPRGGAVPGKELSVALLIPFERDAGIGVVFSILTGQRVQSHPRPRASR
jgi:hypothetical protein